MGKQWSDCSVKQMRDFVTSRKARCLNNKPKGTSNKPVNYRPVNNKPVTYRPVNNIPVTFKPIGGDNDHIVFPDDPDLPVTFRPDFLQTINHVVLDVFKFKEKVLNDFFSKLNTAPSK